MSDPAKSDLAKLKARLARGFIDRSAADIAATDRMFAAIRETYESYGFEAVETPFVEYTDALGKFLPDQDRPNEGVFSFQDDDEQWLSLRYDLTAPLARFVAENFDALPKPYRSYRAGWVFRNEKPGPGRFRQFMQFDADIVGSGSVAADAEICMMAADTLEALGIPRGQYVIKVNNRKVLDGVMEAIGLGGDEHAGRRLTVLRAIDKLDRLGVEGVRLLLGPGRKDESGDFTKGAGLNEEQIEELIVFASLQAGQETLLEDVTGLPPSVRDERGDPLKFVPTLGNGNESYFIESNRGTVQGLRNYFGNYTLAKSGIDELESIAESVSAAGYGPDRIRIDPSVVRGLEYYTGPVFEAELTFEVKDEDGRPIRFGSVGGGGRYDGLVGRFRGDPVPATGFSIGVSRLLAALKAVKSPIASGANDKPLVVVTAMDEDRIGDYQALAARLRALRDDNNAPLLRVETYLGAGRFGAQMKHAGRRGAVCAIIQGTDEKTKGEVQIKDLILGATLSSIKVREEYLAKQAEAQFAAPEAGLEEAVLRVLARHGDR